MEQLVNFIIRPPRADYNPQNDLLEEEFMLKGRWFRRKDLEVVNSQGHVLKCSHYMPISVAEGMILPCVIYCHGNSGCRADASEAAIILLPSYITVFTLDFSGSGLSEGEHVSLGWHEKDDLKSVVNYLRSEGNVSCIGLWGRSMGAVTSLMYGAEDPSIAGMVLDSPFSNLVDLMMELVDTYSIRLPKFTVKFAIQYMRKLILKKAKFDIMDLNSVKVAQCCFVPVLLGHARDDDFIRPHHSDRIYDSYVGDKNIIRFEGDHNSPRPDFYFDSITIFFHNVLNPPKDEVDADYLQNFHNYFHKDKWDITHEEGYMDLTSPDPSRELTISTEDDINRVRSKRPMCRTEIPADMRMQEKQSGSEENGSEHDFGSSSSRLITFDFSNGHSSSPFTPTIIDDQFVEYSFDSSADFPSNLEEEEQMFMEAVLESLKDLAVRHPQEEDQPSQSSSTNPKSHEDDLDASTRHCTGPIETVSSRPPSSNHGESDIKRPSTDSKTLAAPTFDQPKMSAKSAGTSSTNADAAKTVQSSSEGESSSQDADGTGSTRARLTVERNPGSHVVDGLMHRWGLNFFRNTG